MSEGMKIVLTASLTALCGVAAFVIGQLVQKLLIEPIQDFNKARSKIASALTRHYSVGGIFHNEDGEEWREKPEILDKISEELRTFAAEVRAQVAIIPFYSTTAHVFGLPSRNELKVGTAAVLRWAHEIHTDYVHTSDCMDEIDAGLRLDVMWYFGHTGAKVLAKRKRRHEPKS